MTEPFRIARLDGLERIPVEGAEFSLRWLPVRSTLGIEAFGTNAYVAEEAGTHVVEPHTEGADGHEELYFVARGRATFRLGEERVDAPAGTYVFLPDPEVHREAVAEEPNTTVLSFGGPRAGVYEPPEWEPRFRASALREQDPAAARRLLLDARERWPDAGAIPYELACLDAREGNTEGALEHLAEAVRLRPDTADWARGDDDLAALRGDGRFGELVGPG